MDWDVSNVLKVHRQQRLSDDATGFSDNLRVEQCFLHLSFDVYLAYACLIRCLFGETRLFGSRIRQAMPVAVMSDRMAQLESTSAIVRRPTRQ
jgi:hypothetical protein